VSRGRLLPIHALTIVRSESSTEILGVLVRGGMCGMAQNAGPYVEVATT
jgi:hypothetical protein